MKALSYPRSLSLFCLLATFTLLSGCAANLEVPDTVITPTGTGTGDIHGNVYGGRQPIKGAHIYLYGAANTGYGAAGISLLGNTTGTTTCTSPLTADSSGNCYYTTSLGDGSTGNPGGEFNLTGLYKCNVTGSGAAQPGQQVWLYSIGGMPGVVKSDGTSGATVANPAASETAALGTCPTSGNFSTTGNGALSYIYVNEVSTVAFAYAVAGFASTSQMGSAQYVGAALSHYTPNLSNAFANAAQLYDIQGGADPGDHGAREHTPSGNGNNPFLLINTIADAVSTCINSNNTNNSSSPSAACQAFFEAVYGTSSIPASAETASATIYLAQHPGESGVALVFSFAPSESPWQPDFNSANVTAPADATAAITFPSLNSAYGIAIDGSGNAFVTENNDAGSIVKLPSAGPAVVSASTLNYPSYITIDSNGNLWTPGQGISNGMSNTPGVLYEFSSTSLTPIGSSPYTYTTGPGLTNAALQITADTTGYVYVADYGNNDVVQVKNTTPTTATYINTNNLASPTTCTSGVQGIAYNASAKYNGSLWVTGTGTSYDICDISKTGVSYLDVNDAIAGNYIAVDGSGNSFTTADDSSIYEVLVQTGGRKTFSNSDDLQGAGPLAIDGANNVWVLNTTNNNSYSLVELSGSGSFVGQTVGFQAGLLSSPQAIAIDGSGDIWITDMGGSNVKELIGAAIPVTTPLSGGTSKPNVDGAPEEE